MLSHLYLPSEKNGGLLRLYWDPLSSSSPFFRSLLTSYLVFLNPSSQAVNYLSNIVLQHCKHFVRH